jgi:hypothetical protein
MYALISAAGGMADRDASQLEVECRLCGLESKSAKVGCGRVAQVDDLKLMV